MQRMITETTWVSKTLDFRFTFAHIECEDKYRFDTTYTVNTMLQRTFVHILVPIETCNLLLNDANGEIYHF